MRADEWDVTSAETLVVVSVFHSAYLMVAKRATRRVAKKAESLVDLMAAWLAF